MHFNQGQYQLPDVLTVLVNEFSLCANWGFFVEGCIDVDSKLSCSLCVLVRVLQRKRTKSICTYMYTEREIYFKGIGSYDYEAWQVPHNPQGGLARWKPRKGLQFESKDCQLAEFSLQGSQCFSIQAFHWLDWVHPHNGGSSALFSLPI